MLKATRPELRGTFGMVSSTHWLAAGTGMSVLERGGNAFDAATAAGLVLQVVEPYNNGPAGEVPILVHERASGAVRVICGQGTAPSKATISEFRELGLKRIPGSGVLSSCVPGAFGAWMRLLSEYGTWGVGPIVEYAIELAGGGYRATRDLAKTIDDNSEVFANLWPTTAAVYPPGVVREGTVIRNAALAQTYQRVVEEGLSRGPGRDAQVQGSVDAFYRGFVAEAIDRFVRQPTHDAEGNLWTGLLQADDLASWNATAEDSVAVDFMGLRVHKPGPWSQGPVLLQQLRLLELLGIAEMQPLSEEWVHTVVEAAKLAFADRDMWYGDPVHANIPLGELLAPEYARFRAGLIGDVASQVWQPGQPSGYELPVDDMLGAFAVGGEGSAHAERIDGDTSHVAVVDRHGNMVAAMPSGGWIQSSPLIPELGFPLGTRAQMFWLDENHPNGLVPGKRPRTTLSPSMALRNGEPYLAFGSPGGDCQDQWGLLLFLQAAAHGRSLQEAIDAPAFHTTHLVGSFDPRPFEPGAIHIEDRLSSSVFDGLKARGHRVQLTDPWSQGHLCAVGVEPETGQLMAGSSPRDQQGYAVGR